MIHDYKRKSSFFIPFYTTEKHKCGLNVDLYYMIKAAGLLLYSKMGKV